jgi:CheY-like chemotaxis protein
MLTDRDAAPAGCDLRILLTEDDPIVAELYRLRLDREGHEVSVAADGQSALEAIRREPPDLLLLDIRMPRLSGIAVLEELRQDAEERVNQLPVVMLTNYSDPLQVQRSRELGIAGYLVKSRTTPRQLADWIERWSQAQAEGL